MTSNTQNFSDNFYVHFDLSGHKIPILQSIETDESIRRIVNELGRNLKNSNLKIEIFIQPPAEGSHLKKFVISAGLLLVGGAMQPAMDAGLKVFGDGRNMEERFTEFFNDVKVFLESSSYDIQDKFPKDTYAKAYQAKSELYEAAYRNTEIKAIGFDQTNRFPVKRNQFAYHIIKLDENKKDKFVIKIHKLKIVSSINAKEYANHSWQAKDIKKGKVCHIYMKDDAFYEFYWENNIQIKTLLVEVTYSLQQDEFVNLSFKEKGKQITKVFNYNNKPFTSTPEGIEIEKFPILLNNSDPEVAEKKEIIGTSNKQLKLI